VNVVEEDLESSDENMLSISSSSDHPINSWIFDSTFSYHMTPIKYWLDNYMLVNSSSILMGKNDLRKVIGIGNIKIKMFNGVFRTLCDVRRILDLRKNLISLGILNLDGFSLKSEGE
jgi:hypothetical protein